jgi:hypothetical protein
MLANNETGILQPVEEIFRQENRFFTWQDFFSRFAQNVLAVHCVTRYFGARLYEYSTRDLSHIFYCFALVHRSMQNTRELIIYLQNAFQR